MSRILTGVHLLITCFLLAAWPCHAQFGNFGDLKAKKDQYISELRNYPKQDTARANALMRIINTATFLKERQELLSYTYEELALSKKLNYTLGIANGYSNLGHYFKGLQQSQKALIYFDSILVVTAGNPDPALCRIRNHGFEWKGILYYEQENYYPALDHFFESMKNPGCTPLRRQVIKCNFVSNIYVELKNYDQAIEYINKGIAISESDTSLGIEPTLYFNLIDINILKNDLAMARVNLDKIAPLYPTRNEILSDFGYYKRCGIMSNLMNNPEQAMKYFLIAYKNAVTSKHKNTISESLGYLSSTALKLGQRDLARNYALENLALAEETNAQSTKIEAFNSLAEYYGKTGDYTKGYEFLRKANELKDSLLADNNIKQINVLGAIYQSEQKQKEISDLQIEKNKQEASVKRQYLLNAVFVGAIIVLLVVLYLIYRNFKNRQKIAAQQEAIQNQKIVQLEKDKHLLAIDAMLEGQEEERGRIAKDLHDGLGGLLYGTKLSFLTVRDSIVLSAEESSKFDRSLSMLDNTIGDLRKVAHNLMPEALVKFGLGEAVRDFCDSTQTYSGVKVVFQQFGEMWRLGNTAEIFIYRIIQELVNNAIKHAHATEVIVQLTVNQSKLGIAVEDNGKGFDKSELASAKGSGMRNIMSRIEYFNGTIDIVTGPGNGTSVNIELMT